MFVSLGDFDDKSGIVGRVRIAQCKLCGLGISLPPITDIGFLYESRESQDFQPDTRGLAYRIKNFAFRRAATRLRRQMPTKPETLLDFGCGSGQFTRCLGNVMLQTEVVGSDFHADPPPELEDHAYLSQSQRAVRHGTFDAVIAMHVLEHDNDPELLLKEIVAMVKPGGTVVIEVPNINCVWARLLGRHWDAWYVPYHRVHFSRTALNAMINKASLQIVKETNACVPTFGRSLANMANQKNNLFFLLLGAACHPVQWLGEMLTGEASAIRMIAQRD